MRDRNLLSYQQFNIQLREKLLKDLKNLGTRRNSFSQELSFEFRPEELQSEIEFFFKRNFRNLRCLSIILWYLPENLKFLVKLKLEQENFNFLNKKQRIEISILSSSEENMKKYLFLTNRYTGNEIFGNILGNDLKELSQNFKVSRRFNPIPKKKVFRRGPKDYGSRRVISLGPKFEKDLYSDVFLQEKEEQLRRKEKLIHKTISRLLIYLENYDLEE